MEEYDVVIVGAGPAGLRCAEILAQSDRKVLVLEKNRVIGDKVCAGGLTRKGLELGIPGGLLQRKFKKVLVHTPHQCTEVKLKKPFIATIDRKDLGAWMAGKARRQGADIRVNSCAVGINKTTIVVNDNNNCSKKNSDKIRYKYLVGADGSNSMVRKYLGLKTDKFLETFQYLVKQRSENLEVHVDPKKFGPFYTWLFPHKNLSAIGCGADFRRGFSKPPFNLTLIDVRKNTEDHWKKRFDIRSAKFQAAIINYDYKGYDFGNKFLIGDAAGLASGLTGEGIYFAIKSGEDVAKKIINADHVCANIKHILRVKKYQEKTLRALEISKPLSLMGMELVNFLFRFKWFDEFGLRMAD
ncbi:NAD(P)/FAD-dependent oxidoreductase [Candidatus Woesearchaeota archaeon]|nr:NAD(P)/FAD-dependent oxidoreductase [Candidatus Woesearchaeota archaeon]